MQVYLQELFICLNSGDNVISSRTVSPADWLQGFFLISSRTVRPLSKRAGGTFVGLRCEAMLSIPLVRAGYDKKSPADWLQGFFVISSKTAERASLL